MYQVVCATTYCCSTFSAKPEDCVTSLNHISCTRTPNCTESKNFYLSFLQFAADNRRCSLRSSRGVRIVGCANTEFCTRFQRSIMCNYTDMSVIRFNSFPRFVSVIYLLCLYFSSLIPLCTARGRVQHMDSQDLWRVWEFYISNNWISCPLYRTPYKIKRTTDTERVRQTIVTLTNMRYTLDCSQHRRSSLVKSEGWLLVNLGIVMGYFLSWPMVVSSWLYTSAH